MQQDIVVDNSVVNGSVCIHRHKLIHTSLLRSLRLCAFTDTNSTTNLCCECVCVHSQTQTQPQISAVNVSVCIHRHKLIHTSLLHSLRLCAFTDTNSTTNLCCECVCVHSQTQTHPLISAAQPAQYDRFQLLSPTNGGREGKSSWLSHWCLEWQVGQCNS